MEFLCKSFISPFLNGECLTNNLHRNLLCSAFTNKTCWVHLKSMYECLDNISRRCVKRTERSESDTDTHHNTCSVLRKVTDRLIFLLSSAEKAHRTWQVFCLQLLPMKYFERFSNTPAECSRAFLILPEDIRTSKCLYLLGGGKSEWHLGQKEIVLQLFSVDKAFNKHWKETNGCSEWWTDYMHLKSSDVKMCQIAPRLEKRVKEMGKGFVVRIFHNFTRFKWKTSLF